MLLRRYHEPANVEAVNVSDWPEGAPSEKWRTAEIDAYADAHGIELSGAGNKAEKVEVIRAHTAN